MNDFFTPEEEAADALNDSAQQEIRNKIQAEVFEGTPAKFDDKIVETSDSSDKEETPGITVDEIKTPLAEDLVDESPVPPVEPPPLPPEMQAIVDSLNKLTSSLSGMENRIKQTERRVGGISNEFYAAKEAAESTKIKTPTPEAMAEAAKNEEAWEELKTDFPSWATAIDSKISAQTANYVSVDDFESLRKSVSDKPSVDPNQLETRLVGLIHPDWKEITQAPEYATWLNAQPDEIKFKAFKGTTAEEAIDVFNKYKSQQAPSAPNESSEVEQIKAQRAKRLAASTTTSTKHKSIKQKAEADMTEAELREHIMKKVFKA